MALNDATLRQVQAADPAASTWLSANAGSGKTRVLTDRVARLLLAGVEPQNVLCLTYTKAAASEMQNRLFRQLGTWALMPDAELSDAIILLEQGRKPDADALAAARRLFARAIETPGGLRIQTIHSFCAGLLRRFPLEAGVTPNFTEMDDRAAALLRDEVLESIAESGDRDALEAVLSLDTGGDISGLAAQIVGERDLFGKTASDDEIGGWFGIPAGETMDDALSRVFLGSEAQLIADVVGVLQASQSSTDQSAARTLRAITWIDREDVFHDLAGLFLFGAKAQAPFAAKIGKFPTKACRTALGQLLHPLEQLMARVEAERAAILAHHNARRTRALHALARVFLPAYDARKQARGWLDFDDLILKTRDLLRISEVAAWVLYRLDGGIDHILVDEAQDTSPAQWQVIEQLTQEFTSGDGARAVERTIFVVGDPKQSIYSFQGADPREFSRMRDVFEEKLMAVGRGLRSLELEYSFRSSSAVLGTVDQSLHGDAIFQTAHRAFHTDLPGRVELWPVIEPQDAPEKTEWFDPVDRVADDDPTVLLAERIAGRIDRMLSEGETLPQPDGTRRPVTAGDVLILVQSRSALFSEIIRACKAAHLPVAGADRLKLGAELAVRDIAAVLSFLSTPEDDLSLAAALKSPLFGWDEDALFRLAHGRGKQFLWRVLYDREWAHPETVAILKDLRAQADFLRPYDLIERMLTRHDGRRRLLARLGPEAEDGIDALLSQALAYERNDVPSLTGFLTWMETEDVEVKRQLDSAGDQIRVMTVHGAKGLEAPIVILPDTIKHESRIRDVLVPLENGALAWKPSQPFATPEIAAATDRLKQLQAEEKKRLLYVAMTRAEKWLILCGAGKLPNSGGSWYQEVQEGLAKLGSTAVVDDLGHGLRYETGDWAAAPLTRAKGATDATLPDMPDWADAKLAPVDRHQTLSPSDLGGAKALPGEIEEMDGDAAVRRGTLIHLLLEHLPAIPQADWRECAITVLAARDPPVPEAEALRLLDHAARVVAAPSLSQLFAPGTLSEVPVAATLPSLGGARIHGAIDRLVVTPDHVLAVDFKTNTVIPDTPDQVPEGLLRQMGAYAEALSQIYPDRKVETAILWTGDATLMTLPHSMVGSALARTPLP